MSRMLYSLHIGPFLSRAVITVIVVAIIIAVTSYLHPGRFSLLLDFARFRGITVKKVTKIVSKKRKNIQVFV